MKELNHNLSLIAAASLCTLSFGAATASNSSAQQPNIIFILSDDGGYADWGFQGSKQFQTPNLDALAKQGVILEQAYTTDAVSGPSRAGLMTGRYQQRFGIEENNVTNYMSTNGKTTKHDMGVKTDEIFISDYLSSVGYKCAIFGKWHLGSDDQYHPYERGYDHFVGFRSGGRSFFAIGEDDLSGDGSDQRLEYGFGEYKEPAKGEYMTDILADEACKYVVDNKNNPFFIYLAFNAVHTPLEPDPKDMARFDHIEDPMRQKLAAMAYSMDRGIGRLLKTLKKAGVDKNTIIVFGNDNGGPNVSHTSNYPLRGMKATFWEGGIRVPSFVVYPGVIEENSRYHYPISFLDFLPTFTNIAGATLDVSKPVDGVDVLPYLIGEKEGRPHQTLYWKCETRGVVRDGDMKFMRYADRPAELYDISVDESEQNDIARENPELVEKYYKMLFDWEMTLERPLWMLDRKYEARVVREYYDQEEYTRPVEQK